MNLYAQIISAKKWAEIGEATEDYGFFSKELSTFSISHYFMNDADG